MHKYGRELYGEGELKAAPGCYCLLVRYATLCNPHQPRQPPPSHVCAGIHNGGFFCERKCVLCGLDLNIIQMRIKWPRLFKDDAGNVDSNTSEALMVSVFCSVASEWKYLSSSPSAVLLLHMSTRRQWYCERWLRQSFGCPAAQQMLAGKLGSSKTTGLPPLMQS